MNLFKSSFLSLIFLISFIAMGAIPEFETISLGGNLIIRNAETQTLWLQNTRYIKNIIVSAEGLYGDSSVEVMVNGEVKGTIYAPGRDPSYVVTIAETTSSIQFRYRGGGSMKINNVLAVTVQPRVSMNNLQGIGYMAVATIDKLSHFSTLQDEQTYLLPIKKAAANLIVMAQAHGPSSHHTIEALNALKNQIDSAKAYFNQLIEEEGLFDTVVEIYSVRASIDEVID